MVVNGRGFNTSTRALIVVHDETVQTVEQRDRTLKMSCLVLYSPSGGNNPILPPLFVSHADASIELIENKVVFVPSLFELSFSLSIIQRHSLDKRIVWPRLCCSLCHHVFQAIALRGPMIGSIQTKHNEKWSLNRARAAGCLFGIESTDARATRAQRQSSNVQLGTQLGAMSREKALAGRGLLLVSFQLLLPYGLA